MTMKMKYVCVSPKERITVHLDGVWIPQYCCVWWPSGHIYCYCESNPGCPTHNQSLFYVV